MTHRLTLIAAVAANGVVGRNGSMPWHLPGDLAHFRTATLGHVLLMGRKTFEAIGRPLPGRSTVVLSGRTGFAPTGVAVARTLDEALAQAGQEADRLSTGTIMVAGGATLYWALIGRADAMLITEVDASPEGDTVFPPIDPARWREVARTRPARRPDDHLPYSIVRWETIN